MATTVNKQKILDHVYAALKKRYDVPDPAERTVSGAPPVRRRPRGDDAREGGPGVRTT